MGEKFRLLVDQELAEHRPPPVGQMIESAMAEGRRIKRRRAVRNVLAGAAFTGVLLVATAFAVPLLRGTPPPGSADSAARPPVATRTDPSTLADQGPPAASAVVPSRSLAAPQPAAGAPAASTPGEAGTAPATPAAVLLLLTRLLPNGQTSDYGGHSGNGGTITVQTYLNRGQGPGMLHLVLAPGSPPDPSTCEVGDRDGVNTTLCRTFPNGDTLETYEISNNCVQRYGALYVRRDGLAIHLNTSSCLAWDGTGRAAGQRVLSTDEAIAIVTDPAWGTALPRALVSEGAVRFPNLPRVVG